MSETKIDRRGIPDAYRDVTSWPTVDTQSLSEKSRAQFLKNEKAVIAYVAQPELTLAAVSRQTGVERNQIRRLVARCLSLHEDGRLYGFRGLIPQKRTKRYARSKQLDAPDKPSQNGWAGAFTALLRQYSPLDDYINRKLKQSFGKGDPVSDRTMNISLLHRQFLGQCKKLGIREDEYPFCQEYMARRSLHNYVRYLEATRPSQVAKRSGKNLSPLWTDEESLRIAASAPLDIVEIDGHKLDLRLSVSFTDQIGMETTVEIVRIWILVVLDVASRAVLGYHLALSPEYSRQDVIEALKNALIPHQRKKLTIPELKYSDLGGFPNQVFPELAYACWEIIRMDNAAAHLSDDTIRVMERFIGCWPEYGPPRTPNDRPGIESFFNMLAKHFAHRIPGTTGSQPSDAIKKLSDPKGDVKLLMTLDELEELMDVWISNLNGQAHSSLNGRTPLQYIRHSIERKRVHVRQLAERHRNSLYLMGEAKRVRISGRSKDGRRPCVYFANVKYSSEVLSSTHTLVGKHLNIFYNSNDIRHIYAYFEDGSELGVLTAARPWCFTPHTLKMRTEIFKLVRQGKLTVSSEDDLVEVYLSHKRLRVKGNKRAALDYAKSAKIAEKPVVIEDTNRSSPAELVFSPPRNQTKIDTLSYKTQESTSSNAGDESMPRAPKPKQLSIKKPIFVR